jgi:hypothetical protein
MFQSALDCRNDVLDYLPRISLYFVFPKAQDNPAFRGQLGHDTSIPRLVALDLLDPIVPS